MLFKILNVDAHNQYLPIKCVTDIKSLHNAVYSTKNLIEKQLKIRVVRKTKNPFCDVGV